MSIYYTHIWNERYVVWSEWITFVLIHLKLLVAIFFLSLSLSRSRCLHLWESTFDEHILLLLYFICYSILFTCWAFADEISTHGGIDWLWGDTTTKTNGYKAHTCFNFLFLQKFSFHPLCCLPVYSFVFVFVFLFSSSFSLYVFAFQPVFYSLCVFDDIAFCVRVCSTIELMHVYATLFCVCIWAQSIGFPKVMP